VGLTQDPLRFHPGACPDCWGSTIVITPYGLGKCVACLEKEVPPPAARLSECVWMRVEKEKDVDPQVLNVARILLHSSSKTPVSNYVLKGYLRSSEREIKNFVRVLRREWLLPIGSSRKPPSGYFWIWTAAEFLDWARVYRSQAIDELANLYKLQRANFPELAGQESFDFISVIDEEMKEAIK
jgi:hypothetical protein